MTRQTEAERFALLQFIRRGMGVTPGLVPVTESGVALQQSPSALWRQPIHYVPSGQDLDPSSPTFGQIIS